MFCSSYEVYSWIAGFKKDFYEKLRKVGWGLGVDFVENFGIFCQEIHVLSCLWAWLKMSKIPNVSVLIWRHMNGYLYVEIFKAILYETRPEAKLRHFFSWVPIEKTRVEGDEGRGRTKEIREVSVQGPERAWEQVRLRIGMLGGDRLTTGRPHSTYL